MDREDALYIAGILLIGGGAAMRSVDCGLIAVGGLLLFWPIMARICAYGRKPQ